jgi:hypothetical protein
MNKYEQLIEHIINDEDVKARELFHDIVVEKSRDIYENLIDDADLNEVSTEEVADLVDEISTEDEGISEEEHEEDHDAEDHEAEEEMDMDMEVDADEAPTEEEDVEDRVEDLEDALDELKAEFDALMAGEDAEPEAEVAVDAEEMAMAEATDSEEEAVEEAKEETVDEDAEEVAEETVEEEAEVVKEYVEKAPAPVTDGQGADTKSPVAGKNDMGGTAVNMDLGGESNPDGTKPAKAPQPKGDLVKDPLNKPGAKAGKAFSKKEKADNKQAAGTDTDSPIDG